MIGIKGTVLHQHVSHRSASLVEIRFKYHTRCGTGRIRGQFHHLSLKRNHLEQLINALPEAAFMVNISNDAWFGDSLAPHQHLEMARMRALENERWLVRSTNTGISAILDDRGRIVGTVPAFERGAFTTEVQPRRGATPFVHLGNGLPIALTLLMLVLALLLAGRGEARGASSMH